MKNFEKLQTLSVIQTQRTLSILAALFAGIWLPLEIIGYPLTPSANMICDAIVSLASINNIVLYFRERSLSYKNARAWLNLGLAMDLICVLPLALLNRHLLLLNLLTARHVFRIKKFLDGFQGLKPVVYRLVPIALMMPVLVHLVACAWIALGSGTVGRNPDPVVEYIQAIYWAFTTLTTVGYGDISAKTPPQMLFAAGVQVVGVGVFGFVLSNVASLLSRLDAAREHHMENLDRMEAFLNSHQIQGPLRKNVREYYRHVWLRHGGYQDRSILQSLPKKVQSDLLLFINRSIVTKVPFFKNAEHDLLEQIMNKLQSKIFVPGEKIFRAGDPGQAMYFIQNGTVDILTEKGEPLATLGEGTFFGEGALLEDRPRNATAQASNYVDAYELSRKDFQHAIQLFPTFRAHVEELATERRRVTPA